MNKLILVLIMVLGLAITAIAFADARVINGEPVKPGEYTEVVSIKTGNAGCTASIIGPRVMLTAAHCATSGSVSQFSIGGENYGAKVTRYPEYPGNDYDVALGLVDREVKGIDPVNVYAGVINVGDKIRILGYGCTDPGGGGGNDGILRQGITEVISISTYDIISRMEDGAALCYGDSGGPVYTVTLPGRYRQMAVNSKGNIKDTNYTTNLTLQSVVDFMKKFASDNSVDICGVTKDCDSTPQEEFILENQAVKVSVVSKGLYDLDYLKIYFGYLMSYLEDGVKTTLPMPQGELPPGFCSCGDGMMAACNDRNMGLCGKEKSCFCVE